MHHPGHSPCFGNNINTGTDRWHMVQMLRLRLWRRRHPVAGMQLVGHLLRCGCGLGQVPVSLTRASGQSGRSVRLTSSEPLKGKKRLNERRSNGGLSRGCADLNCGRMTGRSGPQRTKSEGAPHGLETGAIALAIAACLACLPSHAHTAQHI
jgi:hypothetical protein